MILRRKLSTFGLLEASRAADNASLGHDVMSDRQTLRELWQEFWALLCSHLVPVGRGNTVCINLSAKHATEIKLAGHRFWLRAGPKPALVDQLGAVHPLHPGKNVVGREKHNDIVIDARYHNVSDKHLMVESVARQRALLTDLSTKGTFVPPQCVV